MNKNGVEVNENTLIEKLNCITDYEEDTVIVCIGTPRIIGDSLGPLVGTYIEQQDKNIKVYGTIENPVHALNLEDIKKKLLENIRGVQ